MYLYVPFDFSSAAKTILFQCIAIGTGTIARTPVLCYDTDLYRSTPMI